MTHISLEQASHLLKHGDVIGVPTETVYGLAASLYQEQAIDQIFSLKKRPLDNPLIIHLASYDELLSFKPEPIPFLETLAKNFWPGPLTLVLPIDPHLIPSKARAGLPTAAFRVPSHPLTLELLRKTGPLVMPSANLSGKPSSTQPSHLEHDFGDHFPILDGGLCVKGLESTILYYNQEQWEIIRQGALAKEQFAPYLNYVPVIKSKEHGKAPLCPGQMYRHYAPRAKLLLKKDFDPNYEGCVLGFSNRNYPKLSHLLVLGDLAEPETIAANLYTFLRHLDEKKISEALVDIDFPSDGLLSTIKERLIKAACKD